MKQIKKYQDENGKEPFKHWVERLDLLTQSKIYAYITFWRDYEQK
jgi:hypothetical protein